VYEKRSAKVTYLYSLLEAGNGGVFVSVGGEGSSVGISRDGWYGLMCQSRCICMERDL